MNFEVKLPEFKDKEYNVLDFGAKSSAEFNNKDAFQSAIDTCHENGGGYVVIPNGFYLTGPIKLKSNVCLKVLASAYVKFTKSKEEYPLFFTEYEGTRRIRCVSPISAFNQSNIGITGSGVIDGSGDLWRGIKQFKLTNKEWQAKLKLSPYVIDTKEGGIWFPTKTAYEGALAGDVDYSLSNALEKASEYYDLYRPVLVSLVDCDRVLIEDATIMNSPAWNIHPNRCTNFTLRNATIKNKFSAQNGDGLDLESCQNCEIANTNFEVGDDGICLKSGKNEEARKVKIPTKNVWIHDCKVYDAHGGFVVGSEMSRGVNNVLVENCIFSGTDIGIRFKSSKGRGGVVENITLKNIYMNNIVNEAIIFTMGYVLTTLEKSESDIVDNGNMDDIPEFKNIRIENAICTDSKIGLHVNGLLEKKINNIEIINSSINCKKEFELCNCCSIKVSNTYFNGKIVNEEFNN